MKKVVIFLLLCLPFLAKADIEKPYFVKGKIVLKNGKSFVAYYETFGYSEQRKFSDIDFQKLIIKESEDYKGKVKLIRSYFIEPKTNFGFINEKEIVEIKVNDIKYTVFYTAFYPSSYSCSGYNSFEIVSDQFYTSIKNCKNLHHISYDLGDTQANVFAIDPKQSWKETVKMTSGLSDYLMKKDAYELSKEYNEGQKFTTSKKLEALRKELESQNIFIFVFTYQGC